MTHYLFVGIPSLLFEPVAVCAVCGIVLAGWKYRNKRGRFYGTVAAGVFLMVLWRLLCHPVMLSARYAAILLYPAVIFTAWLCFDLTEIARGIVAKKPRWNTPRWKKAAALFPALVVAGLVLTCLLKTLRCNPYGDHVAKLCRVLATEIKGKEFYLYAQNLNERERIAYYTEIKLEKVQVIGNDTMPDINDLLIAKMSANKNYYENSYFMFYRKKGTPEPDAETLGIPAETGKWECLHREYTSRRKNREMVLYRFTPGRPNIEVWDKPIPAMSPDNLCSNGGFERELSGAGLRGRRAWYRENNIKWYDSSDFMIPADYWIAVNKDVGHNPFIARLSSENPLAGKYSLLVDTRHTAYRASFDTNHPKQQDIEYSGFVRNLHDQVSTVYVRPRYVSPDRKKSVDVKPFSFVLEPGKTYHFHDTVTKEDFFDGGTFFLVLQANGYLLFDNISIRPLTPQNKVQ